MVQGTNRNRVAVAENSLVKKTSSYIGGPLVQMKISQPMLCLKQCYQMIT